MIGSLSLRAASTRPSSRLRSQATRASIGAIPLRRGKTQTRPAATRSAASRPRAALALKPATWELRSFALAVGAIAVVFALALTYLAQVTSMSMGAYELQRLHAQRDELRRQNALVEVDLARLDSPARIEAQATRLGLVLASRTPVFVTDPLQAKK